MPPKEVRYLNEVCQNIRDNNFQAIKTSLESRFNRKKGGDNFLSSTGGGDGSTAKEVEASVMEASRLKDLTILRYLIEHGAPVNFVAETPSSGVPIKVSPLHVAVGHGLPNTVSLLLENNADVNRLDHNNRSALHLAVKRADCECTRMLLFRGANVHLMDHDGKTPLQIASKFGHVELVRVLLEHSAQIFHEGQTGPSPLHIAAIEGHVPLIDIFSRYVDVNIRVPCTENGKEKTALHLAAERGLVETVRFLLERFGADVNVLDSDDQNALHCALIHKHDHRRMRRKEDYEAMVDLFLKKNVKINQGNSNGNTALHLAAKNRFHRVVEMLLLARADPLRKNDGEQIPLDLIPEYDVQMRQLFSKYAVITSPYLSNAVPSSPYLGNATYHQPTTATPQLPLQTITTMDMNKMPPPAQQPPKLKTKIKQPTSQQHPKPQLVPTPKDKRKVFHVHLKGMSKESSTDEEPEGPHRSVVYAVPSGKPPSAPEMVH